MEDHTEFLKTAPVGKLMRGYALPCIISLLVGALYNIVDQMFIANAPYLGSNGNGANTVVFPLTVVALAIAVMIGDGACAYLSLKLGQGDGEDAADGVRSALWMVLVSSVVVTACYALFREPLLTMFGGRVNDELFSFAKEYFTWLIVGMPLYIFGQAMNPVIRGDGSPKFAMLAVVAGAVTNIILDPVFIFPLHMGMAGAAIATDIGQLVTALLSLWYLCHLKTVRLRGSRFHGSVARRVLGMGMTSLLSQISLVAAMAAINNMIRTYGMRDPLFSQPGYSQIPMAVVGIVMKFFQIIISIVVGMAAGCIPIVGFNMGSGSKDRVKAILNRLLLAEFLVGVVGLFCVEVLPGALIGIFGAANESQAYTDFGIKAFRIYLCLLPLAAINKASFIFLQAMGKAKESSALSLVREIVLGVGLALLLPPFFGLDGVLYSMPAADLLTFAASAWILLDAYRQLRAD